MAADGGIRCDRVAMVVGWSMHELLVVIQDEGRSSTCTYLYVERLHIPWLKKAGNHRSFDRLIERMPGPVCRVIEGLVW